ncbi:type IV pilus assembly protein PilB [Desulfocicer vacuolatum DSM 3385]|uniref:Type IV pilus assembly protein PilB n=2 Tax=Desulfocicer vacuolatum TaxID=2298 RepID=A0A1W1ZSE8_9BACT|nr:type IV pilus assembly protein PilB [Desulfocicer vacuolatum DSM 3385]
MKNKKNDKKWEKLRLGELLVAEGVLSEEHKKEALAIQKTLSIYKTLGEICLEKKFLSRRDLNRILAKYHKRIPLGTLLMNLGMISHQQLKNVLAEQRQSGEKIGAILIKKGMINEKVLVDTLATQMGILKIFPDFHLIDRNLLKGWSEDFLKKNLILPAFKEKNEVTVIMADPFHQELIQDVGRMFQCKIRPAIATSMDIKRALHQHFQKVSLDVMPRMAVKTEDNTKDLVVGDEGLTSGGPEGVVGVLDFIISNAIAEGASDIHIEPKESSLQIRYRIDGILHHKTDLPVSMAPGLSSRIKILCKLDISEKRKHQDGRLRAQVMEQDVDMRVSVYAAAFGENIVIRILYRQSNFIDIDQLGITPENKRKFLDLMALPSGILLVTGPTGSGKTTTLYSAINHINDGSKSIITVEDPVEYVMEGVVQGQLNPKLGHTYVDFIKSMMRQDPDVIMVGEVRDTLSAEAVVQASLTGHKVLTTLHTEDATGGLLRLVEMGIDAFLITSTVVAVMAQRLVRVLCPRCKKTYTPDAVQLGILGVDTDIPGDVKFYKAVGCSYCDHMGYRGRTGIHELLCMNDKVRDILLSHSTGSDIRRVARAQAGLMTMREDGFYKLMQGITSFDEVSRVLPWQDTEDDLVRSSREIIAMAEGAKNSESGDGILAPVDAEKVHNGEEEVTGTGKDGMVFKVALDISAMDKFRDKLVEFFGIYQRNAVHGKDGAPPDVSSAECRRFIDFVNGAMKHARSLAVSPFAELVLRKKGRELEIVVEFLVREPSPKRKGDDTVYKGPRLLNFIRKQNNAHGTARGVHGGSSGSGTYRKVVKKMLWEPRLI